MNSLRRPWAVVAAILLGGPVDAAPMQVYNSLNFINPGETGYGYLGVTSLDKSAIYGDSLRLTATGKLTSFTWAAYNGPGSTDDLTSASQTISFYRQSNASLIGSFNATITDLGKGSYKTFTADLTSANIVLDTPDILVTQQIPFWPPASPTYRLGIVVSASSNTPVIGTTGTGYYRSAFGSQGAFFTDVSSGFAVYAAKLTAFSRMRKSFRGPSVSSGSDKIYPRTLRRFSSASMSANDGSRFDAYHA